MEPKKKNFLHKIDKKWVQIITIWTFFLTVLISFIADTFVAAVNVWIAILILLFIIAFGILFDIIGIAVTAAEVKGFHSMAANRVRSANTAIALIKNADKVSNFCNDVIGDICGIVSGAIGALIIIQFIQSMGIVNGALASSLFTGLISALTVGSKAISKTISIVYAQEIVLFCSKILQKLKLPIFKK